MNHSFNKDLVKQEAEGRWHIVFETLANHEMGEAMKHIGRHVACPMHGGQDGFRLFKDFHKTGGGICNSCGSYSSGLDLLMALFGWDFSTAVNQTAIALGLTEGEVARKPIRKFTPQPAITPEESAERQKALNKVWSESMPLTKPEAFPAQLYLMERRLSMLWYKVYAKDSMRFHPALSYYCPDQKKVIGKFPAIVSMVRDLKGHAITIHRTYLTENGTPLKTQIEGADGKKIMLYRKDVHSLSGCAIQFGEVAPTMGVAEGIETAASASLISGMPVWSCLNATLMENFEIPDGVKLLVVYADRDRSQRGIEAAKKLIQKAWDKGIQARLELPPMSIPNNAKGVDWNDFWRRGELFLGASLENVSSSHESK